MKRISGKIEIEPKRFQVTWSLMHRPCVHLSIDRRCSQRGRYGRSLDQNVVVGTSRDPFEMGEVDPGTVS